MRRRAQPTYRTFWYYTNWDFNVLGTSFERTKDLFRGFKARIADPIGMEDFRLEDTEYVGGADSVYPAYPFRLTARDMARFGLLFLRGGRWQARQIIPEAWVRESVTSYSDAGESGGYGYMWWVAANGKHVPGTALPEGSYSARGAGGHYILVIPKYDLIHRARVNTDIHRAIRIGQRNSARLVKKDSRWRDGLEHQRGIDCDAFAPLRRRRLRRRRSRRGAARASA